MKIYIYLLFSTMFFLSCADSNSKSETISSELKKNHQEASSVGHAIETLLDEYEVERATLVSDIDELLSELLEKKLIELG